MEVKLLAGETWRLSLGRADTTLYPASQADKSLGVRQLLWTRCDAGLATVQTGACRWAGQTQHLVRCGAGLNAYCM